MSLTTEFPFIVFQHGKAVGSGVQYVPNVVYSTWAEYVAVVEELQGQCLPKGRCPAIMHGTSPNRLRSNREMSSSSAICLDIDHVKTDPPRIRAWLQSRGWRAMFQFRWADIEWKVHIVLPYVRPVPIRETASTERSAFIDWASSELGEKVDHVQDPPAGLLFPYMPRPEHAHLPKPTTEIYEGPCLDFDEWLQSHAVQVRESLLAKSVHRSRTQSEVEANDNGFIAAFKHDGLVHDWVQEKGAFDITCPHGHDEDKSKKTILYPTKVVCQAGRCSKQSAPYFLAALSPAAQAIALAGASAQLQASLKDSIAPKVSLQEAQTRIHAALAATRPVERNLSVVRVTTGSGKTTQALEFLKPYTSEGKTAVLATPTNALLAELSAKLDETPHRRQVGVLAVLNDDGSHACFKYEAAKRLQNAGGNVHRLMCAPCEYREMCPARANRITGPESATLTLTNHTLLPAVAEALHEKGRYPLLIWDESPPLVQTHELNRADLQWLSDLFDEEAKPDRRPLAEQMFALRVFSPRFRVALRPLLEVYRQVADAANGLPTGPEQAAEQWAQLPLHEAALHRALAITDTPAAPTPWGSIQKAIAAGQRVNDSDIPFDVLRPLQQAIVLRAERCLTALTASVAPEAQLLATSTKVIVMSPTPAAISLRDWGGVVMDATAALGDYRALRPDVRTEALTVEDDGDSIRTMAFSAELTRKNLEHHADALYRAIGSLKRELKALGPCKVAAFTYLSSVPYAQSIAPEFEWHHYGNTRGYDRFFQEGFDVFASFGDPIQNLDSLVLKWFVLHHQMPDPGGADWRQFVRDSAAAELAQAHGRARDPQPKLAGEPGRFHYHFGRITPLGWDLENTEVDPTLSPPLKRVSVEV